MWKFYLFTYTGASGWAYKKFNSLGKKKDKLKKNYKNNTPWKYIETYKN